MNYRHLMSHWPTGVSLVTTWAPDGPRGCTANAVTSLSLDPPLLLVCFDRASRTLRSVQESKRFCVNVLTCDQEELARKFALKETELTRFDGLKYRTEDGVPVLEGSLAHVVCRVESELAGGDHVIVLGEPLEGRMDECAAPLIFFRGTYWQPQGDPQMLGA